MPASCTSGLRERAELLSMLHDAQTLNSVEVELRKKDGQSIWALKNLTLVGDRVHTTVVDISDRKRAEEQIEFHAYHDVLTNLPNRKLFTDRLTQSISRARRSGKSLAVMFVDLDHFKSINDTLGHEVGDELLLEMAQRLSANVREYDTVARLGGDEFTIILSELRQPEDAVNVAEKVIAAPSSSRCRSPGRRSKSPPASASRSIPTTAPTRSRCCATPTARCTARRKRAATRINSARTT